MSPLLIIGIVMMGLPAFIIFLFATYIFFGFINDDKDARAIFNIALLIMAIGLAFIITHAASRVISFT